LEKTGKVPDRAWVPFALLALFYLGGLWQRPMFDLEYPFAMWLGRDLPAFSVRLGSALATLLTAGTLFCFLRRRDRTAGGMAAAVFLSFGAVFAAGTAADRTAYFTLGFTVAVCASADLVLRKKPVHLLGLGLGVALCAYALTRMPPTAFRREFWPWYLLGFFPYLLFLPVLAAGGRRIGFRAAVPRTAVAGTLLGFAALALGEWTAGLPFLAVLTALALARYAETDPQMTRFDRLLKHWVKVFSAAGILLVAGYCLFRFGKVRAFPLPNNMTMTVFAILILVVWSVMASREPRLEVKTCYLALGAAFFLCGLPAMIPAETLLRRTPAELVRRCWPQGAPAFVAVAPELRPMLYWAKVAPHAAPVRPDRMPKLIGSAGRVVLLVREPDSRLLPFARRKIVLRTAGLAIMEYER